VDREGVSLCLGVGPDWGGAIEVRRGPSPAPILTQARARVNPARWDVVAIELIAYVAGGGGPQWSHMILPP